MSTIRSLVPRRVCGPPFTFRAVPRPRHLHIDHAHDGSLPARVNHLSGARPSDGLSIPPTLAVVPSLNDLAPTRTDLTGEDVDWLHLLLADWQLLADLSFADLVLWLPLRDRAGFVAAAHVRPSTGPTAHHHDMVGTEVPRGRRPQVDTAYDEQRICRERDPDWPGDVPVREETIPVVRAGRVVAVVSRHTNLAAARTPEPARAHLPAHRRRPGRDGRRRAGSRSPAATSRWRWHWPRGSATACSGWTSAGVVTFASPNARVGLPAARPGPATWWAPTSVTSRPRSARRTARWTRRCRWSSAAGRPGRPRWRRAARRCGCGSSRCCRTACAPPRWCSAGDVTEVRRRERDLIGKDATIREIHHRVKNNLQTVAALLRLQARRLPTARPPPGRRCDEAERRIGSIAVVHETLSQTGSDAVDFDEVADRVVALTGGAGHRGQRGPGPPGGLVRPAAAGGGDPAGAGAVELVQNAVEHGLAGRDGEVRGVGDRGAGRTGWWSTVADDGAGLPAGFDLVTGGRAGPADRPDPGRGGAERDAHVEPGAPGTRVTLDLPTLPPER